MIQIFDSLAGRVALNEFAKGCWINVTTPTPKEIEYIQNNYEVPAEIVRDILDADERPRVEYDDDWTLVIFRIPVANPNNGVPYYTVPLGIFISEEFILTLCSQENEVLKQPEPSLYPGRKEYVTDALNFLLKLSFRSAQVFLSYLKEINRQTAAIEQDLEKSIRNKELSKLLRMEKCLVYFITSLKANELVLAKLGKVKRHTMSEVNSDLLEDAIIENKQALEMAKIYSDIQSGMMDAFASVISNNLNVVMKQLASISIILMIPTLVASLYGMNVPNHLESNSWAFPIIIGVSTLLSVIGILIFRKRDWF